MNTPKTKFNYDEAFCRNLGWITPFEATKLKNSRVAIAGAGGVGGIYLITLARLGIANFHISDPDTFELKNFNRQYGAGMDSIDRNKCDVMVEKLHDINPEADVKVFDDGISAANVSAFLNKVDVYVDGLDLFEIGVREIVFAECTRRNIPFITVGPIGMGAALMAFTSTSMSFEDYFGVQGKDPLEKVIRFTLGLAPSLVHLKSLIAREYSNVKEKRVGSTPMGCALAAGVMGTEVMKHILNRGPRTEAPQSIHYDAYTYKLKKTTMWMGCKNPIFRLKLAIFHYMLNRFSPKRAKS